MRSGVRQTPRTRSPLTGLHILEFPLIHPASAKLETKTQAFGKYSRPKQSMRSNEGVSRASASEILQCCLVKMKSFLLGDGS